MKQQDLLEYLKTIETPHIVDAMKEYRGEMDSAIQTMVPGVRMVGPAFTVDAYTESVISSHKAMQEVKAGDVIVIDGKGALTGALWGECITTEAVSKGVTGVVVDGAIRDIGGIRAQGFPVFARCHTPRPGTNQRVGFTSVPITCGAVLVNPGDIVVGDDEGIVVIPVSRLEAVVKAVREVIEKEAYWKEQIRAGVSLAKTIGLLDLIYPKK